MGFRTDLAIENVEGIEKIPSGVDKTERKVGSVNVIEVNITTEDAANEISRPMGRYITVESGKLLNSAVSEDIVEAVKTSLQDLLPKSGTVLVVGIGNTEITSDALGPKTVGKILATRHISSELAEKIGLKGLKSVAAVSPGVLGQTGIEVKEIIDGAVSRISPSAIIAVDALAARDISRLCSTIQISDTGISPGSGIGNKREELSQKTLGIPCISIGVPTVVDAETLCFDLTGVQTGKHESMIVTPKEIDMLIEKASDLLGNAINIALQPEIDPETLLSCV